VRRTDLETSDNLTDEATAAEKTCEYDGREQAHNRSKALRADAPVFVPAAQGVPTATECQVESTQVDGTQVLCSQELPNADTRFNGSDMRMNETYNMHIATVDAIKKVKRRATDVTVDEAEQDEQQQTELPQMPVFADLKVTAEDYQNDATFSPMYAYLTEHQLTGDKEVDYRTLLLAELYLVDSEKLYKLVLPRGRKRKTADNLPRKVLVVPKKFENAVLTSLHSITGHAGAQKMYDLARLYVYMPRLFEGCTLAASSCQRCHQTKFDRRQQIAPLGQMPVFQIGTTWVLDFKNLPRENEPGIQIRACAS
jgi:hypothetical protein